MDEINLGNFFLLLETCHVLKRYSLLVICLFGWNQFREFLPITWKMSFTAISRVYNYMLIFYLGEDYIQWRSFPCLAFANEVVIDQLFYLIWFYISFICLLFWLSTFFVLCSTYYAKPTDGIDSVPALCKRIKVLF